jgi:hypothetical protein
MEMFLSIMLTSLLGVLIAAVLFKAAIREPYALPPVEESRPQVPSRFFADDTPRVRPMLRPDLEVLVLQIERHVRLEQAAAEAFHDFPSREALRMPTLSPLVH